VHEDLQLPALKETRCSVIASVPVGRLASGCSRPRQVRRRRGRDDRHAAGVVVTAPERLWERLRPLPMAKLVETAARFQPDTMDNMPHPV
jgi:hypothetical protein